MDVDVEERLFLNPNWTGMELNLTSNYSIWNETITPYSSANHTDVQHVPPSFDNASMVRTILLSVLFLISFIGNTATLLQMYRVRKRRSTINILIVNLAIADLIVTFFAMAAEAIWQTTVQWLAGNSVCKLVRFIQGFGFLLSTYVTVVISLDRCCVILDPMSRNKAPQRVRVMVAVSWFLSALFSIPQALVFSVQRGPFEVDFYQCISTVGGIYNKMYNIFCLLMQFMLPLSIMIIAYGLILCTISRKSKEFRDTESTSNSSEVARGQVKNTLLHKAKKKALRMSVFIVLAFIVCWFPYYVIFTGKSFGYWNIIDPNLMKGLSMMGLTNSIINPIIYGAFQLCKVNKTRLVWRTIVSKPSLPDSKSLIQMDMENLFRSPDMQIENFIIIKVMEKRRITKYLRQGPVYAQANLEPPPQMPEYQGYQEHIPNMAPKYPCGV